MITERDELRLWWGEHQSKINVTYCLHAGDSVVQCVVIVGSLGPLGKGCVIFDDNILITLQDTLDPKGDVISFIMHHERE